MSENHSEHRAYVLNATHDEMHLTELTKRYDSYKDMKILKKALITNSSTVKNT